MRDLVPFVQFKKHEKHPWRSVTFNFTKSSTPLWVFFMFFELYKWYQIAQDITNIGPHCFEDHVKYDEK